MSRFRSSSLRRVCQHCKTKFKPTSAKQEFHTPLCKAAWHYERKKTVSAAEARAAAEALFVKRKQEALVAVDRLGRYQSSVAAIYAAMEGADFSDVKFMATKIGVLAVEARPGAMAFARGFMRWSIPAGREFKIRTDDSDLTALLSLHTFGGPYMAQQAEKECRALIKRGPADAYLFTEDWDYFIAELRRRGEIKPFKVYHESNWPRSDRLEDHNAPYDEPDSGGFREDASIGFDGEIDPRDEPSSSEAEMPEDAGVMDHADPFWR